MLESFLFTCCQGEWFLRLPYLGMAHIPSHYLEVYFGYSIILPAYTVGILALAIVLYHILFWPLLSKKQVNFEKKQVPQHSSPSSFYLSTSLPLLALILSYSLIARVFLPGWIGRQIASVVQPARVNYLERYVTHKRRLERWENEPEQSPLGNITVSHGPEASLPFWNASRAEEIYDRVMSLQNTHWTYTAPISRGSGLFLLGRKYGGAKQKGWYLDDSEQTEIGLEMWTQFADVMEELRVNTENLLHQPARLYRDSWPPTFIMHAGSVLSSHRAIIDVHTDSILPKWFRKQHAKDTRLTCDWDSQLTLLVALNIPPSGASFEFYDSAGNRTSVEHKVGKALLCECGRPHNLGPFHASDADARDFRMVLHAFLVPCHQKQVVNGDDEVGEEMNKAVTDQHYQIIGPLGFGTPYSTFAETLQWAAL